MSATISIGMGCGASSNNNAASDRAPAEAPGDAVDTVDMALFDTVGEKAQAIMDWTDKLTNANECLGAELVSRFDDMKSILDTLSQAGPVMEAFQETFSQLSPIIETVAHLAIPPPGGQVVAAVLRLTAMIAKGAMNVRACRELSARCNELLQMACSKNNLKAKDSWNEGMLAQLDKFLAVCNGIHAFVEKTLKQGWVKKIIMWKNTADELVDLQDGLNTCWRDLVDGAALGTFNIVAAADAEHKKIASAISKAGGPEKLCENEALLKDFIKKNGYDVPGLNLQLTKQVLDEVKDIKRDIKRMLMKQKTTKAHDGPASLIANEQMKAIWRDELRISAETVPESVPWKTFLAVLKKSTLIEDFESVLGGKKAEEFKLALDKDDDNAISVFEVNMAFPKDVVISEQIELLRNTALKSKGVFQAPAPPLDVVGRHSEINELTNGLESPNPRVLIIRGNPGEGKLTVATSALKKVYEEKKAVGGVWYCRLSGVMSAADVVDRLLTSLSKGGIVSASDSIDGKRAALKSRVFEISMTSAPSFLLLDDFEELFTLTTPPQGESDLLSVSFEHELSKMMKEAPLMKVIFTSRTQLSLSMLERELGAGSVKTLEMVRMSTEGAISLLRSKKCDLSETDAKSIAENFQSNPTMLSIVGQAIMTGVMTVEQAKSSAGLSKAANQGVGQALANVELSIKRSLDPFPLEDRSLLLKVAILFVGPFDEAALSSILELSSEERDDFLGKFKGCSLILPSASLGGDEMFEVTPLIRETARNLYKNAVAQATYKIGPQFMCDTWAVYVSFFKEVAFENFRVMRTAPQASYNMASYNRANIQQALRMILNEPKTVKCNPAMLNDLIEILSLLPYFNGVHDGAFTIQVCNELVNQKLASGLSKGICRTVRAFAMPSSNGKEQEEVKKTVDEVVELLGGLTDAQSQHFVAMALRRKGVVLRDMGEVDESIQTLQKAKNLMDKEMGKSSHPDKSATESILVLAELAGSIDYTGNVSLGEPIAEEALRQAEIFYVKTTPHPVTAQCLTVAGYFKKGKEEHEAAIDLHEKAKKFRLTALGKNHIEVAVSLQQAAISKVALGRYEEAEADLRESERIRKAALDPGHFLIFNTHRELSKLYKAWGDACKEEEQLKLAVIVGKKCWGDHHKKVLAALADLVNLLRAHGRDGEADAYEQELVDAAASDCHLSWMERNPKGDWNASQHVPYDQLPENEKQKDRDQVKVILALIVQKQNPSVAQPLASADTKASIIDEFGSLAHETWRKGLAASGHIGPRMKKTSDGSDVDINVPWFELHPEWKRENIAAGRAAVDATAKAFGFIVT